MNDMTEDTTSSTSGDGEWFRSSDESHKGVISGLREGPRRFVFEEKEVEYSVIDGKAIFEGDIYLGEVDEAGSLRAAIEIEGEGAEAADDIAAAVAITGQQFRWPLGVVPYEIHPDLPNQQRVHNAIDEIEEHTSIRFVERTTANESRFSNYIHFFEGDGCWSSVGMRGDRQRISLAAGCGFGATVHEILHALGSWHEQSREDRNTFVTINFQNILAGREHNFNQHIVDGDDIDFYDYGSIMHYGRFAFTANGLPTIVPVGGQAIGQRNGMSLGDIVAIHSLYPPILPRGLYTLQQRSNGRFVDAHESPANDFSVVTRTAQNNDTQRWMITPVGMVCTMRQVSSDRFVDAHQTSSNDFSVVTRSAQNNDTQRWVLIHSVEELCTYTIQQLSNGRFIDAHQTSSSDFSVVTRSAQNNDTQRWILAPEANDVFTIRQVSSGRFLDAHESAGNDFSVVTRNAQNNDSQRWVLVPECGVYTIQQRSSDRFMDAHESSGNDFSVVTRKAQENDTQRWVIQPSDHDSYTIQQLSNSRFVDAHETSSNDFSVVTRTAQNNDTQRWMINPV
jgi:hypothetical protein